MAPDKSLAAEIEASDERASRGPAALADELQRLVDRYGAGDGSVDRLVTLHFDAILDALRGAEIAALQSRGFEDGARWMRERAVKTADYARERAAMALHGSCDGSDTNRMRRDLAQSLKGQIAALPLQPEGGRNA